MFFPLYKLYVMYIVYGSWCGPTYAFKCQSGYQISILRKYLPLNRFRAAAFDGFSEFFQTRWCVKSYEGFLSNTTTGITYYTVRCCRASINATPLLFLSIFIQHRGLIIPQKPQIFCTYRKSTQYTTQKCDCKRACERAQVIFEHWRRRQLRDLCNSYVCMSTKRGSEKLYFSIEIDIEARETTTTEKSEKSVEYRCCDEVRLWLATQKKKRKKFTHITQCMLKFTCTTQRSRSRISHQSFVSESKREKKEYIYMYKIYYSIDDEEHRNIV